jgi:hypothetical protein
MLLKRIEALLPLACKDAYRERLRGVLVKPSPEPGFVELHVTDGHKAVIEKVKASIRDLPDKGLLVPSSSITSLKAMLASLRVSKTVFAEPDGYMLDKAKYVLMMDVGVEGARHLALPVSLDLAKTYPSLRQVINGLSEKPNVKLGISVEYLAEIVKAYKGKSVKHVSLDFHADKAGRCLSPVTVGVEVSDFAENAEIIVMPVRV